VNSNLNSLKTTAFTSVGSGTILLTTNAGIWKFNDANNNWSYFTNGIKNSQGRSMAFSQNGDVVVGTDNGMYRSTDGGNTWAHAGLTDTAMMSTILYAPDGRMFAGNTHPTASHIFTSINNGASWYTNETGFSSTRSSDFDYNSQGKIFIGTGWANPMHSSSDGVNWNGPSGPTLGFLPSSLALAIAINSVDVIFAGTENDGVYRSIDNGVSYSYIGLANNPSNISDIKISPNQDVFVSQTPFTGNGNGNFYRSKNGGNTWSANLMSTHGLPNCIYIAGPDSIFVGTTKGVWLSTDTASTWTLLNSGLNPGNLIIHTLEIGPDGYLYAGTAGAGIYKSANKIKGGTLTGVTKHVSQNTRMMIYPNPANDLLNFSSAIKDLKIYNLLGELVLQKVGELNSVSTSNLTNGIYFIRTNQGTLKFIVKH
ncbi:MAG: T9SS type A sorting domain-containing protein, partial [Bacteroidota bacterium]|nr:T9SS type A sorting domain-containing protein [Bacteroidota bacterium]